MALLADMLFLAVLAGNGFYAWLLMPKRRHLTLEETTTALTAGLAVSVVLLYYGSWLIDLRVSWLLLVAGAIGWLIAWRRVQAADLTRHRGELTLVAVLMCGVGGLLTWVALRTVVPTGYDLTPVHLVRELPLPLAGFRGPTRPGRAGQAAGRHLG